MTTWINDLANNAVLGVSLQASSRSTNANGTGVDLVDTDGECFAFATVSAVSAGTTAPTVDISMEESTASGGTYTAITGATFAQITAAGTPAPINFKRTKRFVRAVGTVGGTTPTWTGAVLIMGQKKAV
jgi:hypothetical protein